MRMSVALRLSGRRMRGGDGHGDSRGGGDGRRDSRGDRDKIYYQDSRDKLFESDGGRRRDRTGIDDDSRDSRGETFNPAAVMFVIESFHPRCLGARHRHLSRRDFCR